MGVGDGLFVFFVDYFHEVFFTDVDVAGNLVGKDALEKCRPLGTIAGRLVFKDGDKLHKAIDGTYIVGKIEWGDMRKTYFLNDIGEDDGKENNAHVAHQLGEVGRL